MINDDEWIGYREANNGVLTINHVGTAMAVVLAPSIFNNSH